MSTSTTVARLGSVLAAAGLTFGLTATTALAAPAADPVGVKPNGATSSSTTVGPTKSGGVSPAAVPSGCYGHTHNPHPSYSFASVHGDTDCPYVAPMIVSINLLRWRWYGLQHLANGSKSGTTSYVNGNAKWYCRGTGTYTYRGESYHRVTVGGRNYIAYTANEERFPC